MNAFKRYKGAFKWNEPKIHKGGQGYTLRNLLRSEGIKVDKDHSPYVGHVGMVIHIDNKAQAQHVANVLQTNLHSVWVFMRQHRRGQ